MKAYVAVHREVSESETVPDKEGQKLSLRGCVREGKTVDLRPFGRHLTVTEQV